MQVSNGSSYAAGAGVHAQDDLLLQQAQGDSRSAEKTKIEKAGRDFESILLGSWLQGAEKSFAAVPGGDDDQDSGGEQFMSMAMQQLATTLAASGGIGIGKMITEHLEAAPGEAPKAALPEPLPFSGQTQHK